MLGILIWCLMFGGLGYLVAGVTGMWVGIGIVVGFWLLLFAFLGGFMAFLALLFRGNK